MRVGSSPRVRGKPRLRRNMAPRSGLIPACAGKTKTETAGGSPYTAHPRVCGENRVLDPSECAPVGSSPRVRGKRVLFVRCWPPAGLIPACAGKTIVSVIGVSFSGAHPRVCGENFMNPKTAYSQAGSSPRVRGKRRGRGLTHFHERLIPACAGKTPGRRAPGG